jgi:hypothetical protein
MFEITLRFCLCDSAFRPMAEAYFSGDFIALYALADKLEEHGEQVYSEILRTKLES